MMGSNMFDEDGNPKYTYDFNGYDNEYKDTNYGNNEKNKNGTDHQGNNHNHWREDYYDRVSGSSMGIVDGVMTLTANITKPSNDETGMWSMMGDDMRSMVVINGKGPFPDLTTCSGLQFEAMMTSSEDDDTNTIDWDEFKYRVEFGYKKLPDSVFGFGYRADLVMQPPSQTAKDDSEVDNDNDDDAVTDTTVVDIQKRSAELSSTPSSFMNVVIPFEEFTIDWNWNTGEINTSCEENEDSCPDEVTLKNMETMTISAVGSTNGVPV